MTHRHALITLSLCTLVTYAMADGLPAQAQEQAAVQEQPVRLIDKQAIAPQAEEKPDDKPAKDQAQDSKEAATTDAGGPAEDKQPSEEELRKKMQELERELQNTRNEFQQKANEQREKAKQEAQKKIEDINLPEKPTRKQCEEYLSALRKATDGRNSFSSSDPVTQKLKEIPVEHMDLLVTEMANRTSLRYYANYAMREMDPEQLRERFVASLDENPNNIGIIVMHGWCEDARPAIINYIQSADSSITPAWFQAAVELSEPTLYPKLHELTTQSRYASQFVSMLEMLPDYDLSHTVDVCWRRARDGKLSVSYGNFAEKAAEFGNVDALGVLIGQLQSTSSFMSHSSSYNMRRPNVLKFIDYRGSNKEIQEWFEANQGKLVFDEYRKRFILPEAF